MSPFEAGHLMLAKHPEKAWAVLPRLATFALSLVSSTSFLIYEFVTEPPQHATVTPLLVLFEKPATMTYCVEACESSMSFFGLLG